MIATHAMPAVTLVAMLLAGDQPAVLPARRPEFEPGFDLNGLLDDAGRRAERKLRKDLRQSRLMAARRAALEARP